MQAPNLECFIERVVSHPERLQYIYFNTVLMLRAVARLGPYLSAFDYCSTGNHEDDQQTLEKVASVVDIAQEVGKFDENMLFRGENANVSQMVFHAVCRFNTFTDFERRIQNTLPQRHSDNGLRRMRQMSPLGKGTDHGSRYSNENPIRNGRKSPGVSCNSISVDFEA